MSRIAMLCPAATGHLKPMMALGAEIKNRGHQVIFYQAVDSKNKIEERGFTFRAYGEKEFPSGSIGKLYKTLGELSGLKALKYTIEIVGKRTKVSISAIPKLLREDMVDILVYDQLFYEGSSIADELDIPCITVSNALVLNQEKNIPPFFTLWEYNPTILSQLRNQIAYSIYNLLTKPVGDTINEYRKRINRKAFTHPDEAVSPFAQISQLPSVFDFPRLGLPKQFHYVGPFLNLSNGSHNSFPFEKLTGKPLIYSSMGTLHSRLKETFLVIAEACQGFNAQLVISLGGTGDHKPFSKLQVLL